MKTIDNFDNFYNIDSFLLKYLSSSNDSNSDKMIKTAAPQDRISKYKITIDNKMDKDKIAKNKMAMVFIYLFEKIVPWNQIDTFEELENYVKTTLLTNLYNVINPENEVNYYIKDFPIEAIRAEYTGDMNHPPNQDVVRIVNSVKNKEEGFELARQWRFENANKIKKAGFFEWWELVTKKNNKTKDNIFAQYIILKRQFDANNAESRSALQLALDVAVTKLYDSLENSIQQQKQQPKEQKEVKVERDPRSDPNHKDHPRYLEEKARKEEKARNRALVAPVAPKEFVETFVDFDILAKYDDEVTIFNETRTPHLPGSTLHLKNGWIGIPSQIHDPVNFETNLEILHGYSNPVAWCTTKDYMGRSYLGHGDFWIYVEDGKAKVGIKWIGEDTIAELVGPQNVGVIDNQDEDIRGASFILAADYWEEIMDLSKRTGWDMDKLTTKPRSTAVGTWEIAKEYQSYNDKIGDNISPKTIAEYRKLTSENKKKVSPEDMAKLIDEIKQEMNNRQTLFMENKLVGLVAGSYADDSVENYLMSLPKELEQSEEVKSAFVIRAVQIVDIGSLNILEGKLKKEVYRNIRENPETQDYIAKQINMRNINSIPSQIAKEVLSNKFFLEFYVKSITTNPNVITTIEKRILNNMPRDLISGENATVFENLLTNEPLLIFQLNDFFKKDRNFTTLCEYAKKGLIQKIKREPAFVYQSNPKKEQISIDYVFNKQNLENNTKYLEIPQLKDIIESPEVIQALKESFQFAHEDKISDAWRILNNANVKVDEEDLYIKLEKIVIEDKPLKQNVVDMITSINAWTRLQPILLNKLEKSPFNIIQFPKEVVENDDNYMRVALTYITNYIKTLTQNKQELIKYVRMNSYNFSNIASKFPKSFNKFGNNLQAYNKYADTLDRLMRLQTGELQLSNAGLDEDYLQKYYKNFASYLQKIVETTLKEGRSLTDLPKFLRENEETWKSFIPIIEKELKKYPFNIITLPTELVIKNPILLQTSLSVIQTYITRMNSANNFDAIVEYIKNHNTKIEMLQTTYGNLFNQLGGEVVQSIEFARTLTDIYKIKKGNTELKSIKFNEEYIKANWDKLEGEFQDIIVSKLNPQYSLLDIPKFLREATFGDVTFMQFYKHRLNLYLNKILATTYKLNDGEIKFLDDVFQNYTRYGLDNVEASKLYPQYQIKKEEKEHSDKSTKLIPSITRAYSLEDLNNIYINNHDIILNNRDLKHKFLLKIRDIISSQLYYGRFNKIFDLLNYFGELLTNLINLRDNYPFMDALSNLTKSDIGIVKQLNESDNGKKLLKALLKQKYFLDYLDRNNIDFTGNPKQVPHKQLQQDNEIPVDQEDKKASKLFNWYRIAKQ